RLADTALERGADDAARKLLDEASGTTMGTLEHALLVTLRSRLARSEHADRATLVELRARLREAEDALLAEWARVALRPGGIGFWLYGIRCEPLGELCRLELALEGEEAGAKLALEELVKAQALGSLARELGLPPASLDEIQKSLPEGRLLLSYFFAPQGSLL